MTIINLLIAVVIAAAIVLIWFCRVEVEFWADMTKASENAETETETKKDD